MIETLDFSADGYMVYYTPLPPPAASPSIATSSTSPLSTAAPTSPPQSRREREQSARRRLVAAVLGNGVEISHHPDGAPYIAAAPPQPSTAAPQPTAATPQPSTAATARPISISHSSSTLALAVATSSSVTIGIDIEAPRRQLERTASRFLSVDEKSRLATLIDPAERIDFLLRCWTAKEAVYKAARTPGLPLAAIVTDRDFLTATVATSPSAESAATVATSPSESAATAAPCSRYALTYRRLPTAETLCIASQHSNRQADPTV